MTKNDRNAETKKKGQDISNDGNKVNTIVGSNDAAAPSPFLGREIRVEINDRRVLIGTLIAYMGTGDLLLQNALEERRYADGEYSVRALSLVVVPFKHVVTMHRRHLGHDPIILEEKY